MKQPLRFGQDLARGDALHEPGGVLQAVEAEAINLIAHVLLKALSTAADGVDSVVRVGDVDEAERQVKDLRQLPGVWDRVLRIG